ncbi:aminotransferase class V-fold PLP-dependent enzyme [Peptostreptococcus faecalis]|uniref:aminotransferase class V-fold PLP-dependent enzyme n=1 Tax=Peptostreptococcus faecalis TaxID=2045015 RepID=UPI000C7D3A0A|nr:aminotransferase class V-fold PLP-dependent enzyme [Peptostreptococcus faecalis]
MERKIYIDNASTCFPKAPGVAKSMSDFIENRSYSINRGTYMSAYRLSSEIIDIREQVLSFFKASKRYECVFSSSATESINLALRGSLCKGDEIIVDERLHNSAWRTLSYLEEQGVKINYWKSYLGDYRFEDFEKLVSDRTKMVFLTLVENISGEIIFDSNEISAKIAKICNEKDIIYALDAVQAVCEREIYIEELGADIMICASHIGFMGPEGVGIMLIEKSVSKNVKPLIYGGTGSSSNSEKMPETLPDKFEPGTMNTVGIIGLGASISYINSVGISNIIKKKHHLGNLLRYGFSKIEGVDVRGYGSFCSLTMKDVDESMLSFFLDTEYEIMTRVGIQCSPCTHIYQGSYPNGGIRFTVGYFNTESEIRKVISAVEQIVIKLKI